MEAERNNDEWVVMRCASKETVPLAKALEASGLEVFAPYIQRRMRKPRSHSYIIKEVPVLSTFLFIPGHDIDQAKEQLGKEAAQMAISGVPVIIRGYEVDRMRLEVRNRISLVKQSKAQRAKKQNEIEFPIPPKRPEFKVGAKAKINSGVMRGFIVTVVSTYGDVVEAAFEKFPGNAQLSTFLLDPYEA